MTRERRALALLLVVALAARSQEPDPVAEHVKLLREATELLKPVKDAAGAKAAVARLQTLGKMIDTSKGHLKKAGLDGETTPAKVRDALRALSSELTRLDNDAKTFPVVRDLPLFRERRKALESTARIDVEVLSQLADTYKLNIGAYPKTIAALAEKQPNGGPPLMPKEKLRDPWGQPYQIDPKGKHNKGLKADVWSKGHPVEKKPIGNWRDKPDAGKAKGEKKPL